MILSYKLQALLNSLETIFRDLNSILMVFTQHQVLSKKLRAPHLSKFYIDLV